MSQKRHAVGLLTRNRWPLTELSLNSFWCSTQPKESYDLFIMDNGSDESVRDAMVEWFEGHRLPVKSIFFMNELPISRAWNLFLETTRDYAFRTRIDNDIVFANTPMRIKETPVARPQAMDPEDALDSEDAPKRKYKVNDITELPMHSVVKGVPNQSARAAPRRLPGSSFITFSESYMRDSNCEMVSMLPVAPGQAFPVEFQRASSLQFRSRPFLMGGCVTMSKKAFETCGYFDEALVRSIDIDYSFRMIRSGMNIGYHDSYWVWHMGAGRHTDGDGAKSRRELSRQYLAQRDIDIKKITSKWSLARESLDQATQNGGIIRLT